MVAAFADDRQLRQNLLQSVTVMLKFYGWQGVVSEAEELSIKPSSDRQARESEWICPFDHNYLRITRILKCLMVFGLKQPALAFYACLEQVYRERSDLIGGETFGYWKNAVRVLSDVGWHCCENTIDCWLKIRVIIGWMLKLRRSMRV